MGRFAESRFFQKVKCMCLFHQHFCIRGGAESRLGVANAVRVLNVDQTVRDAGVLVNLQEDGWQKGNGQTRKGLQRSRLGTTQIVRLWKWRSQPFDWVTVKNTWNNFYLHKWKQKYWPLGFVRGAEQIWRGFICGRLGTNQWQNP